MINRKQLDEMNATTTDGTLYHFNGWDYEFNVKTQELWDINDGYGKPEFLCVVTNQVELQDLLDVLP